MYYFRIQDDDECTLGTHNCGANEICVNGIGTYSCACIKGYTKIGAVCSGKFYFVLITKQYPTNFATKYGYFIDDKLIHWKSYM